MRLLGRCALLCLAAFALWSASAASADEVHVAVAANFSGTLEKVAKVFAAVTGHSVVSSSGSSGQLSAQVTAGAPFDVFLSADTERAKALEAKGLVVKGTRFVYARGRLALWSAKAGFVDAEGKVLSRSDLGIVAVADPRSAPYGAAAKRVLQARGLWDPLERSGRLSVATSVTQAFQFTATAAASCGFVSLAQVLSAEGKRGSHWLVPVALSGVIDQEAALLVRGKDNPAAKAFLSFLRNDERARAIVKADGYDLPDATP